MRYTTFNKQLFFCQYEALSGNLKTNNGERELLRRGEENKEQIRYADRLKQERSRIRVAF